MKKTDLNLMIDKLFNMIEDYSDIIDGIPMNDPVLKMEKDLIKLNTLLYNSSKVSNDLKKNITALSDKIITHIQSNIKKFKTISTKKNDLILKVQEKTDTIHGYFYITSPVNSFESFHIAKIPFLIWCIGNSPYQHGEKKGDILYSLRDKLIEIWGEPISYSGEKLVNDNLYHSEWIRSIGIYPEDFYEFVKKNNQKWFNDFVFSFANDFIDFIDENFDLDNFLNSINNLNEDLNSDFALSSFRLGNFDFQDNTYFLKSIPYNINKNSSFPIYFSPVTSPCSQLISFNTKCIIVQNSDESLNELALNFSDFNNSIIFTRNASKTAHLINIAGELNLNIFYLPSDIKLDYNYIYKLEEDGTIEEIAENTFENPGIALQNCEDRYNWYQEDISLKVSNLAKCYNQGVNVPSGFFRLGTSPSIITTNKTKLIARSAGNSESSSNASFSGIFKSERLDLNSFDNNSFKINKVIESFSSPVALKYSQKLGVSIPKCGIFYQEFIKAEKSFCVKLNYPSIYIEKILGSAEGLVNGTASNIETFDFDNIADIKNSDFIKEEQKLIDLILEVHSIINNNILEFEIVFSKDKYYLIQVI